MISRFKLLVALLLSIVVIAGCATIAGGGSTQTVNLDSNPQGAEIFLGTLKNSEVVDLVNTGLTTPNSLEIPRKNAVVILKKPGYKDTNVILEKSVNGWFFGNIIIGGFIGSSIDSSTGAVSKYDPDAIFLELVAE